MDYYINPSESIHATYVKLNGIWSPEGVRVHLPPDIAMGGPPISIDLGTFIAAYRIATLISLDHFEKHGNLHHGHSSIEIPRGPLGG